MEILKFTKKFWTYICGIYLEENATFSVKLISILINLFHGIGCFLICYGGFLFYIREKNNSDKSQTMLAILQIFSNLILLIIYSITCVRKTKLSNLRLNFQKIVDKRYNDLTAKLYEKAEHRSEMMTKWPFILLCSAYDLTFLILLIILVSISLIQDNINVHTWPNILALRFECKQFFDLNEIFLHVNEFF